MPEADAKPQLLPRSAQYPFTEIDLHLIAYLSQNLNGKDSYNTLRTLVYLPKINRATIKVYGCSRMEINLSPGMAERRITMEQVLGTEKMMRCPWNKNHHIHSYWRAFGYYARGRSPDKYCKFLDVSTFPDGFVVPRPEYLEAIFEGARHLETENVTSRIAYLEKREDWRIKKIMDDFETWSTFRGKNPKKGGQHFIWATNPSTFVPVRSTVEELIP
ncbi:MAG: hypothetical protein Q9170_002037 [Blastenia crenularia]